MEAVYSVPRDTRRDQRLGLRREAGRRDWPQINRAVGENALDAWIREPQLQARLTAWRWATLVVTVLGIVGWVL